MKRKIFMALIREEKKQSALYALKTLEIPCYFHASMFVYAQVVQKS